MRTRERERVGWEDDEGVRRDVRERHKKEQK